MSGCDGQIVSGVDDGKGNEDEDVSFCYSHEVTCAYTAPAQILSRRCPNASSDNNDNTRQKYGLVQ